MGNILIRLEVRLAQVGVRGARPLNIVIITVDFYEHGRGLGLYNISRNLHLHFEVEVLV